MPEAASRDEEALARFRNEVRTARRVSNPNVCRVYDVGEIDGQTFLSMEYIDGEDLARCFAASAACRKIRRWRSPASFAPAWAPRITKEFCTAT